MYTALQNRCYLREDTQDGAYILPPEDYLFLRF